MFRTEIKYKNFLDVDVTETLRFNLRDDELLDLVKEDSMFDVGYLAYLTQERDYQKMLKFIRKLITVSYGEMTEDGRSFRKSKEIAQDFMQSNAYIAFRDRLLSDESGNLFAKFVMETLPSSFAAAIKEKIDNSNLTVVK